MTATPAPARTTAKNWLERQWVGSDDVVVDGVVAYCVYEDHPALAVVTGRGLPLIQTTDGPGGRRVLIDDAGAGRAIAERLASLGHHRIGVVGPSPFPVAEATSDVIALDVLQTLSQRGFQPGAGISATGFEDIPSADAGLTTIRQPICEHGHTLANAA